MSGLEELLARVEAASAADRELDEAVARALGWHRRRVSRLGLNGRTPGSYRWFGPAEDDTDGRGRARPPALTGPRMKRYSVSLLKALLAQGDTGNAADPDRIRREAPRAAKPSKSNGMNPLSKALGQEGGETEIDGLKSQSSADKGPKPCSPNTQHSDGEGEA